MGEKNINQEKALFFNRYSVDVIFDTDSLTVKIIEKNEQQYFFLFCCHSPYLVNAFLFLWSTLHQPTSTSTTPNLIDPTNTGQTAAATASQSK